MDQVQNNIYDVEWQTQMLSAVMHNDNVHIFAMRHIKLEYLGTPALQFIFEIVQKYYKQYSQRLDSGIEFLRVSIDNLNGVDKSLETTLNEYEHDSFFATLDKIREYKTIDPGNTMLTRMEGFIQTAEFNASLAIIQKRLAQGGLVNEQLSALGRIAGISSAPKFHMLHTMPTLDDLIDMNPYRVPTGCMGIDSRTGGGLAPGEMGNILAPTGVGKTTVLTNICLNALLRGVHCLFISLEMSSNAIALKLFTMLMNVDAKYALLNVKYWPEDIRGKYKWFQQSTYFNRYATLISKTELRKTKEEKLSVAKLDELISQFKDRVLSLYGDVPMCVYVDHLDLLDYDNSGKSKYGKNTTSSELDKEYYYQIDDIAKKHELPIWTAAQTNRSGEGKEVIGLTQTGGNYVKNQPFTLVIGLNERIDDDSENNNVDPDMVDASKILVTPSRTLTFNIAKGRFCGKNVIHAIMGPSLKLWDKQFYIETANNCELEMGVDYLIKMQKAVQMQECVRPSDIDTTPISNITIHRELTNANSGVVNTEKVQA